MQEPFNAYDITSTLSNTKFASCAVALCQCKKDVHVQVRGGLADKSQKYMGGQSLQSLGLDIKVCVPLIRDRTLTLQMSSDTKEPFCPVMLYPMGSHIYCSKNTTLKGIFCMSFHFKSFKLMPQTVCCWNAFSPITSGSKLSSCCFIFWGSMIGNLAAWLILIHKNSWLWLLSLLAPLINDKYNVH